jgi:hypothetical protein
MRSAKRIALGILAFSTLALSVVPAHAQGAAAGSDLAAPAGKGQSAAGAHQQRMRQHMGQHQHGQRERAAEQAMGGMAGGCPMMQGGAPGEHRH